MKYLNSDEFLSDYIFAYLTTIILQPLSKTTQKDHSYTFNFDFINENKIFD